MLLSHSLSPSLSSLYLCFLNIRQGGGSDSRSFFAWFSGKRPCQVAQAALVLSLHVNHPQAWLAGDLIGHIWIWKRDGEVLMGKKMLFPKERKGFEHTGVGLTGLLFPLSLLAFFSLFFYIGELLRMVCLRSYDYNFNINHCNGSLLKTVHNELAGMLLPQKNLLHYKSGTAGVTCCGIPMNR